MMNADLSDPGVLGPAHCFPSGLRKLRNFMREAADTFTWTKILMSNLDIEHCHQEPHELGN
jgi:hypothetical protein